MIDRIVEVNGKQVCIAQDLSLSHAGTVWDGALILVHYWNKNKQQALNLLKDKRVLELGSGTGIVGLAAAAFGAQKVYLTDLPQYLQILQINKQKNKQLVSNDTVEVRKLQWQNKQDIDQIANIDTIIGSELAYDKKNVIQLMNTIKYYKEINPKLQVIISYQNYKEEWKNMEVKFKQYFHGQFGLVGWEDMDEDYRDDFIRILYMK